MLEHTATPIDQAAQRQLNEMLNQVRDRFIGSLADRVQELEAFALDLQAKGADFDGLHRVAFTAHKIAGVAGTVGFKRLGIAARRVEQRINSTLTDKSPAQIWFEVRAEFVTLVEELETTLRSANQ